MKRFTTLWICALLILGSILVPSNGSASVMSPLYTYISVLEVGFDITGSTASCYGCVSSSSQYDISITMTLMRRSGSIWVKVRAWTNSGSFSVSLLRDYTLSIAGDYKLIVLGKIIDGNGNVLESASITSQIETY